MKCNNQNSITMNDQEKQEFEALQCEVKRLRIWVEAIYQYASNLGIRNMPGLSNDDVLKGADPFAVDAQLQQLVQRGDVNGASDRYADLTGIHFSDAKAIVKKAIG